MKLLLSRLVCILISSIAVFSSADARPVPSWDKQIDSPKRFKVLKQFNDEAVLDKETGLVWQRAPESSVIRTWAANLSACELSSTGGRFGWRSPTGAELASLIDPTNSNPALPDGHPFLISLTYNYWSSTAHGFNDTWALSINFEVGSVDFKEKSEFYYSWCVRGGQGH